MARILLLSLLLLGARALLAHNGETAIARPIEGIVVDGDLSDWPDGLAVHPITRPEYGDPPRDAADLSASFRVGHDPYQRVLYVAVEVADESIVSDSTGAWDTQDGCELYVSGHTSAETPAQVALRDRLQGRRAEGRVQRRADHHTYEWAVPYGSVEEQSTEPFEGLIAFDLSICDRDEDGSFSWLSWGTKTSKMSGVSRVGDLLLMANPEGGIGLLQVRTAWADAGDPIPGLNVGYRSLESAVLQGEALSDDDGVIELELPTATYEISYTDFYRKTVVVHAVDTAHVVLEIDPLPRDRGSFGRELLTGVFVTDVVAMPGATWFATDEGLIEVTDGQWVRHLPGENLTSLAVDGAGVLWAGTRSHGAIRFTRDDTMRVTTAEGLVDRFIRDVAARNDTVWFATRMGVTQYGGSFSTITTDAVTRLLAPPEGGLWIGTANGVLSREQDGSLEWHGTGAGLRSRVTGLARSSDGTVWIGTHGGLARLDSSGVEAIPAGEGLTSDRITDLAVDGTNRLWIGTWDGGLGVFDGAVFQNLSSTDGLVHHAVTDVDVDTTGLWIATENGVSRYEPQSSAPSIRIRWSTGDLASEGPADISADEPIAIDLSALSATTHASRLAYVYRLDGHEDWQVTRSRRIEYESLPSGDYTFRARVTDRELNYSDEVALPVTVHTPPTLVALVSSLSVVSIGFIVALVYAVRQRQERNRVRDALMQDMEHELQTARQMQLGLMPSGPPDVAGLAVAGTCLPASHVGGDMYQYYPTSHGLTVALADVTGHSMEAAIPSVMFSGLLEQRMEIDETLAERLEHLNRTLSRSLSPQTFICLSMVSFDLTSRTCHVTNCGCPSPLLYRAGGDVIEELEIPAYPLGVRAETSYTSLTRQLDPGDRLILLSDGIPEARNAIEDLGYDRMLDIVVEGCRSQLSPEDLLEHILRGVDDFAAGQPADDDRTCVVIEVTA